MFIACISRISQSAIGATPASLLVCRPRQPEKNHANGQYRCVPAYYIGLACANDPKNHTCQGDYGTASNNHHEHWIMVRKVPVLREGDCTYRQNRRGATQEKSDKRKFRQHPRLPRTTDPLYPAANQRNR